MKAQVKRAKGCRRRDDRICDPDSCDCCLYIGEGDFLCDNHQVIVISDWEPTEDYLTCKGGIQNGSGND